ncbi:unnamed protein product [Ilex paraguariensis]|uniref:Uncharacterized protein n=1 Tax=Ilex paraguariensis TaxID=185542 RepID=A0ABC8R083_9AQUA
MALLALFIKNAELLEQGKEWSHHEVDPKNSNDFILLLNHKCDAIAGKWTDFALVRRLKMNQKMQENPGWWISESSRTVLWRGEGESGKGKRKGKITDDACENLRKIMIELEVKGGHIPLVGDVLLDMQSQKHAVALEWKVRDL